MHQRREKKVVGIANPNLNKASIGTVFSSVSKILKTSFKIKVS